jgi:hypothetical protein
MWQMTDLRGEASSSCDAPTPDAKKRRAIARFSVSSSEVRQFPVLPQMVKGYRHGTNARINAIGIILAVELRR